MIFALSSNARNICLPLLFMFLFCLLTIKSFAQDNYTIAEDGHLGGYVFDAMVKDNYAYLLQGNSIVVLELSSQAPTVVATLSIPGDRTSIDLFVAGDYLYFSVGTELHIVDVSNPVEPAHLTFIDLGESKNIWHVFASGNLVFLALSASWSSDNPGMAIIDVADPYAPQIYQYPNFLATRLFAEEDYAYAINTNNELEIWDVSDPANAVRVDRLGLNGAKDIFVSDGFAFILGGIWRGLHIVNISDPQNAALVKTYEPGQSFDRFYVLNDFIYLAVRRSRTVKMVDVSNVNNPVLAGEFERKNDAGAIQAVGGSTIVYTAGRSQDLDVSFQAVDVSDKTNPQVIQEYISPNSTTFSYVAGNTFYVGSEALLHRYDHSTAEFPILEGSFPDWTQTQRMATKNDMLYLVDQTGVLHIIDFSDPANPQERSAYQADGTVFEMLVQNGYGYLLDTESRTFEIVDLSNPFNPVQSAKIDAAGTGRDISAPDTSDIIYVAYFLDNNNFGIQIFDVSDQSAPTSIRTVQTRGKPFSMERSGNTLFVSSNTPDDLDWFLEAFDISDPLNPVRVAETGGAGIPIRDIALIDATTLLVSLQNTGLAIYGFENNTLTAGSSVKVSGAGQITLYAPTGGLPGLRKSVSEVICIIVYVMKGTDSDKKKYTTYYDYGKYKICRRRVNLAMEVNPPEASEQGCTTIPAPGSHRYDLDQNVDLLAIPNEAAGWNFKEWSGDVSGQSKSVSIKMIRDKKAIANFVKPILTLAGGKGAQYLCPGDSNRIYTIIDFSLKASVDDSWKINSVKFVSRGTGDEVKDIKAVRLYFENQLVDEVIYVIDNGAINLNVGKIITQGETKHLHLEYEFQKEVELGDTLKTYFVDTKAAWVNAEPETYTYGIKEPPPNIPPITGGPIAFAPVFNQNTMVYFGTIQDAIDAESTEDGHVILVCQGTYQENVLVEKSLTIQSIKGRNVTIMQAADVNEPVFQVKAKNATITGFTIQGSRGAVRNSKVKSDQINATANPSGLYFTSNGGIVRESLINNFHGNGILCTGNNIELDNVEVTNNGCMGVFSPHGDVQITGKVVASFNVKNITNCDQPPAGIHAEGNIKGGDVEAVGNSGSGLYANGLVEVNKITSRNNNEFGIWSIGNVTINGNNNDISGNGLNGIHAPNGYVNINGSAKVNSNNKNHPEWNNRIAGIYAQVITTNDIEISGNRYNGIYATEGSVELGKTKITDNEGFGIWAIKDVIIKGNNNNISDNGLDGIYAPNGYVHIDGSVKINNNNKNRAECKPRSAGIYAQAIEAGDIEASGNCNHGIFAANFSVQLGSAKITNNVGNGIWSIGNVTINGNNNDISDNGRDGIFVPNGFVFLPNGTVCRNQGNGIYAQRVKLGPVKLCENKLGGLHILGGSPSLGTANSLSNLTVPDGLDTLGELHRGSFNTSEESTSSSTIEGSKIVANVGDGIRYEGGTNLAINKSNILENSGFGLNNLDPSVTINAKDNWWGDASGPGGQGSGDEVSGNVDFSNWRTSPVTLVTFAGTDTAFIPIGQVDSVYCSIQNWENLNDVVDITVEADFINWMTSPSEFSLTLQDSLGAVTSINVHIPSDVKVGASSKIKITANSQSDPTKTDADSFYVIGYSRYLAKIEVTPDNTRLRAGQSVQIRASGYDSIGIFLEVEVVWTATGGTVDSTGFYIAGSNSGTFSITALDPISQISGTAVVKILPMLAKVELLHDSVFLEQVDTFQFNVLGYDSLGAEVDVLPIWSVTGGTIDPTGLYTAGSDTGIFQVIVKDSLIEIGDSTAVYIRIPTKVVKKDEPVIPTEFALGQNYPNPFNPETTICFNVKERVRVVLKIYDIHGRLVKTLVNASYDPGQHKVVFDANRFVSGLYFYKIEMGDFQATKKMLLLK